MQQATERGFDTNEVVLHGLMPVTGSRRLNCYVFYDFSMQSAICYHQTPCVICRTQHHRFAHQILSVMSIYYNKTCQNTIISENLNDFLK